MKLAVLVCACVCVCVCVRGTGTGSKSVLSRVVTEIAEENSTPQCISRNGVERRREWVDWSSNVK